MSKEGFIPKNNAGEEVVLKRANELQRAFNLIDVGDSKSKSKRFLKSLITKIPLINEVDSDKYTGPYILYPNFNEAYLVLERKQITGVRPYNESTKGMSKNYQYTKVIALGYQKLKDRIQVGFFGKDENNPYIIEDPDRGIFLPLDAGMLFTETVTEEEIVPTLALAAASYEYNKGKPLNDQITFPSEI